MAMTSTRRLVELDAVYVLAPERYHPLREQDANATDGVPLAELVQEIREAMSPGSKKLTPDARIASFDTSHAHEGFLEPKVDTVAAQSLRSARKVFKAGDVLISRLRPYLRQVALVDLWFDRADGPTSVCSGEFYVLRSRESGRSIAFLVPFLLSSHVQEVLAAAQEGGHHPRVRLDTLMRLRVPQALLRRRADLSRKVEALVSSHVESLSGMQELVRGLSCEPATRRRSTRP